MTNYFSIPFTSLCCLSSKPGSFYSLHKMCSLVLSAVLFCFSFGIETQRSVCVIVKEGKEMAMPEHEGVIDWLGWAHCALTPVLAQNNESLKVAPLSTLLWKVLSFFRWRSFYWWILQKECGRCGRVYAWNSAVWCEPPQRQTLSYATLFLNKNAYKATHSLVTPKCNKLKSARLLNGFTSCCIFVVVVF